MELIPNEGIGDIRFGMTPPEVRAVMGDTLVYEKWMGGNLNDTLPYSGIVLFFDKSDAYGPLNHGRLVDIWLSKSFNATFKGIKLFEQTQAFIENLLQQVGVHYEVRGTVQSSGIFIKAYDWELTFETSRLVHMGLYSIR